MELRKLEHAAIEGREYGATLKDKAYPRILEIIYSQACEWCDPQDGPELDEIEYDMLFGAYIGGALGGWYQAQHSER